MTKVSEELRSRARRYGYTGQTVEKMLADLHHDGQPNTVIELTREWSRANAKVKKGET